MTTPIAIFAPVLKPPDAAAGAPVLLAVGVIVEDEVGEEEEVEEEIVVEEMDDELEVDPPWMRKPGLGNPVTLFGSTMNRKTYCCVRASWLSGIATFHRKLPAFVRFMPTEDGPLISGARVLGSMKPTCDQRTICTTWQEACDV